MNISFLSPIFITTILNSGIKSSHVSGFVIDEVKTNPEE